MAGYGSDGDFSAWLTANGLSLPVGSPTPAVLRQLGSDYVDGAYEPRLQCSSRTGGFSQERAWPRTGHVIGCMSFASAFLMAISESVPDDLIPQPWINASYRAAYLQAVNGFATGGGDPNRLTKREKADVLEREFFAVGEGALAGNAAPGFIVDPLIDGWLSVWLCPKRGIGFLVI